MEGKSDFSMDTSEVPLKSTGLLSTVQLQFLTGCFDLGTANIKRNCGKLQHYQVKKNPIATQEESDKCMVYI